MEDGWCPTCQTTTDGECIHLEDGTTIPHPRDEISRLRADLADVMAKECLIRCPYCETIHRELFCCPVCGDDEDDV